MYIALDKDTIEILLHISRTKRGFPTMVLLVEIVNAILYKLNTSIQCCQLFVSIVLQNNL